ncbi:IclR family transcriptional regulator [Noviherbaspirillum sp. CPCC 100848]|uniref:IclR family transcriptional regulator n=1 Tax=Noviherbaspirillum album TaxID=3080276 RepID=A0ABU6JEU2_9BURK|nr:IclR family transcriptional regulator [Noviherbaspirillum sp. CPCC 100848]MEC4722055.1 IclR family transcriptional regulator [Noviherbaspirillum sp. CPCC 100848]
MNSRDNDIEDLASAEEPKTGEDRYFITALSRGLDVLSCFRSGDVSLSNQQISERCGLPKSTVTRIVYTLSKRGYLIQVEPGGRYALGTATLALGSSMLARMDIRQIARPLMQELADYAGATLALGVRDRLSIIYTEVVRSTATLALTLQVGSRLPLATSAIGRAYLANASLQERNAVVKLATELDDSAGEAMREGIARGLQDYQEYGCATSFCDWQKDVNGIAVAFRSSGTIPAMVMNCGGPSSSLSKEFLLEEVRPRLLELVRRLESSSFG